MGRQARELSNTGFYHVILRGINRQHIFEEVCDYNYFVQTLRDLKVDLLLSCMLIV
jgi:REP element-mobilizing transposase RayT